MKVRYLKQFIAGLPNDNLLKEFSKDPKALDFIHDPTLSCNECSEEASNKAGYDKPGEFLLKHVIESRKFPLNFNNAFSGARLPEGTSYKYKSSKGSYKHFKTLIDNHFDLLTNDKIEVESLVQHINNMGFYIGIDKFQALALIKNALGNSNDEWTKILSTKSDWKTKMEEFVRKCEVLQPLREQFCKELNIEKIRLDHLKMALQKNPKIATSIIKTYRNKNIFNKMESKEFFDDENILGE